MSDLLYGNIDGLLGADPSDPFAITNRDPGAMDQEQFLTLMIVQLQNQDPTAPMESADMASQMAQFSSLKSLNSIDEKMGISLEATALSTQAVNNTMAASLIGKEVIAVGDGLILDDGHGKLIYSLAGEAQAVKITITDIEGNIVRTIDAGFQSGGEQSFDWDGTSTSGADLPNGIYRYQVSAVDANESPVGVYQATSGIITGVNYEGGVASLMVGGMVFPMGDVISIRMAGS